MPNRGAIEFALYVCANVINRLAIFVLAFSFHRLLDLRDYGRWSVWTSCLLLAFAIFDLGLSKSFSRFYFDHNLDDKVHLSEVTRRLRSKVSAILLVLTLLIAAIAGLIGASEVWATLIAAAGVTALFEVFILFVLTFLRVRHLPGPFLLVRAVQTAGSLAAAVAGASRWGIRGAALGYAGGAILGAGVASFMYKRTVRIALASDEIPIAESRTLGRAMISYGAPLTIHDVSWWARNSSDPLIMSFALPSTLIGLYYLGYTVAGGIGLIIWSADLALSPYYYKYRLGSSFNVEMLKSMQTLVVVAAATIVSLFLLAAQAVRHFFPSQISEISYTTASIVAFAMFFQVLYITWIKSSYFLKETRRIPLLSGLVSASAILLNLVLLPHYGVYVCAWVTVLAFIAMAGGAYIFARQRDAAVVEFLPYVAPLGAVAAALLSTLAEGPSRPIAWIVLLCLMGVAYYRLLRSPRLRQVRSRAGAVTL